MSWDTFTQAYWLWNFCLLVHYCLVFWVVLIVTSVLGEAIIFQVAIFAAVRAVIFSILTLLMLRESSLYAIARIPHPMRDEGIDFFAASLVMLKVWEPC